MSKVAQAVREFMAEMQWRCEELAPGHYRLLVPGKDGYWTSIVACDEDGSWFGCTSIVSMRVPASRRAAVAEYITRANYCLRLGRFQMDYADGEVSFATSAPTGEIEPNKDFVRALAFANFTIMERYLPGLMAVAFGKIHPSAAIRRAERLDKAVPPEGADPGSARHARPRGARKLPPGDPAPKKQASPSGSEILKRRRVAQVARYLRMMGHRRHNEVKRNSFLVVSNHNCRDDGREQVAQAPEPRRMVQFCFHEDWFAIDVPNTVIEPAEATRVLGERRGFFREANKGGGGITSNVKDLAQFDPIGKKYVYGDEREAAEDAAYVLFGVGGVPVGATLYVTAKTFGKGPNWEDQEPLA